MSQRRSSPIDPLVVVAIVAAVPALLLWSVWKWADGSAREAETAVPADGAAGGTGATAPDGVVEVDAGAVEPSTALQTGLLSYRRSAGELSRRLNVAAFENAVQPLLSRIDDRSCAVVALDGRVVGERDRVVLPASNQKILVAAAAVEILGEDYRYRTTVIGPEPVGGVVNGDVALVGGGDPVLSGDWYPDSGLDRFPVFGATSLDELAASLAAAGIVRIDGMVRGDGSRYDDEWYVDSWGGGVAGIEAGPYDALLANDARIRGDDQRGSDPNAAAAREFVRILAEQGVTVTGGSGTGSASTDGVELAAIESATLTTIIAEMLTTSDNNTAELLVKEIGLVANGVGTRQAGLDAIASTIAGWGVDTGSMVLADGSGLSLDNRVSCGTLVAVLHHAGYESAVGQGLPIAGRTGTLADVFVDTPVEDRLRGKTGTLNNPPWDQDPPAVKALSGYLPVDGGGAIEYAVILNGPTISDQREYRPAWAELVTALNSFPAVAGPARLGPVG